MLSINTQPDFVSVPVEFMVGTAGSYKITFGNVESFNASQPLFFEDKVTSTVINIRNNGEYVFASNGTPESGRFVLHFQEVGMGEQSATLFSAWSNGNQITITPKTGEMQIDQLEIYNMTGQLVFSTDRLNLPATISLHPLTRGLYILKMKSTEGYHMHKLLVR
jgi:hypothetical protein